jgi:putative NADH-flavin reductase
MKIAVVAADGRVAKKVIAEALNRGHEVTAFGRHDVNETPAKTYIKKDILNLTKEDLQDFDAVVDAFGAWAPEALPGHSATTKHLADILSGTNIRLLIVGGAGSLYVDSDHKVQLVDTPDFPDAFKPLATAMGKALAELRLRTDVKWTYISPAADFQADGERTGKYILAGEEFKLNSKNESIISYADYAIAMVDEIEKGQHIQQRISVVRA